MKRRLKKHTHKIENLFQIFFECIPPLPTLISLSSIKLEYIYKLKNEIQKEKQRESCNKKKNEEKISLKILIEKKKGENKTQKHTTKKHYFNTIFYSTNQKNN